jgi:pyruvate dehydrogenase E1 component
VAATIPNCKAYDPAFAGELAVILDRGMREMLVEQRDVFYYVTLMNENYANPDLPESAREGVVRGGYSFGRFGTGEPRVTLLGSGAILTEVVKAAHQLAEQGIASEVLSITSWSELARSPEYASALLAGTRGPLVAATDYVRAVPEQIRAFVPAGRNYTTLGTDGFGRSDTRAALRAFFGVDAASIVRAAARP